MQRKKTTREQRKKETVKQSKRKKNLITHGDLAGKARSVTFHGVIQTRIVLFRAM